MRVTQPGFEAHAVIVDVGAPAAAGGGRGVVRAARRGRRVGTADAAVRRGRGDGGGGVGVDVHQVAVLVTESEMVSGKLACKDSEFQITVVGFK